MILTHKIFLSALTLCCATVLPALQTAAADPYTKCRTQNPEWYICSTDSDCITTYNPCGWPTDAVNKLYKSEAETCNRHVGAILSCVKGETAVPMTYIAKCKSEICIAHLPTK